jgi:hypothetical protein
MHVLPWQPFELSGIILGVEVDGVLVSAEDTLGTRTNDAVMAAVNAAQ